MRLRDSSARLLPRPKPIPCRTVIMRAVRPAIWL